MKRQMTTAIKIAIPIAILAWLFNKESEAIGRLVTRPKDMGLLTASLVCLLVATMLSFVRWFMLVRALALPFTIREAFRLGFLGYLFNYVGPGAVGGDVIKAYFLVRGKKGRRAEAVATILIDRVVGVFSLFVVATTTFMVAGVSGLNELRMALWLVVVLTCVGLGSVALLLAPALYTDWLFLPLMRRRWVGGMVARVRSALELYRQHRLWLVAVGLLSIVIHILVAITIHLADRSVHPSTTTFSEHLIISPLASVAGAVPVPGGLGTYELAMDYLFQHLPQESTEKGQGLAVALVYRVLTVIIAAIGVVYYLTNREEVSAAMEKLDQEGDQPEATT